jgi:hypothetical protein
MAPRRKKNKDKRKARREAKKAAIEGGFCLAVSRGMKDGDGDRKVEVEGKWVTVKRQLFRLKISDDDEVKVRVRGKSRGCRHGFGEHHGAGLCVAKECHNFVRVFANGFNKSLDIQDAIDATSKSFTDVWYNHYKMNQVLLFCLAAGAEYILDQDEDHARTYAFLVSFFLRYRATQQLQKSEQRFLEINGILFDKVDAMRYPAIDLSLLTKFFKRLIRCSCLDEKYEEEVTNVVVSDEEEANELQSAHTQKDESNVTVDETTEETHVAKGELLPIIIQVPETRFAVGVVQGRLLAPYHKKNDGMYKFVDRESVVQAMKEKELEEDIFSLVNQAMKIAADVSSLAQADLAFDSDQLSYFTLPESHTPHQQITSLRKRSNSRICPHTEGSLQASPGFYEQVRKFIHAFTDEYNAAGGVLNHKIRAAYHATKWYDKVWKSSKAMQFLSGIFMDVGVDCLLEGDNKAASQYASIVYCLEQYVTCNLRKDRPTMNWPKINELYFDPDEHTLISFFKKRISCACLDGKYKQVKSIPKLGICYNVNCPLPDRKVVRSFTKCCSRCRRVNYCSRDCQVDNWQWHKMYCYGYVQTDSTVPLDDQSRNTCTEVPASEDGDESHNTCVEASISE